MSDRQQNIQSPLVDPARHDQVLDVIPEVVPGVLARRDAAGCVQLKAEHPPATRLAAWLARRLGFRRVVRVNLDGQGSRVWEKIDGKTTLRAIERAVREEAALDETECKRATVRFISMLMNRNLVRLYPGGMQAAQDRR